MRKPAQNRAVVAEENRGPDPANVLTVPRWDESVSRLVMRTLNFEERSSFVERHDQGGGVSVSSGPAWLGDPDVVTVGELRRGGVEVDPERTRVVCPRYVDHGGLRRGSPGRLLTWAEAVELGVVP